MGSEMCIRDRLQVHQQQVDDLDVGAHARQQLGGAAGEHRPVPGPLEGGHEPFAHERSVVRDQHGLARRGR